MNLIIHHGTHEIGGSCVEITNVNSRIIIDIGMPLVNSIGEKFNMKDYETLSGKELLSKKVLPDIKGTPYLMDHSAYDAYAFLIEADGEKIIYSGDFREHGRKESSLLVYLFYVGRLSKGKIHEDND